MKLKARYKIGLSLVVAITVAVLCTLPLLAVNIETIYIYTKSPNPTSEENGFISELKNLGYRVKVNHVTFPPKDSVGFWLKSPEFSPQISSSQAKYNFLYTDEYYPIEWQKLKKIPIMLTPYKDLYEHYVRTNIKAAEFDLGVNMADFYIAPREYKYSIIYYGDNNKNSPLARLLSQNKNVKFLGNFWGENDNVIYPKDAKKSSVSELLRQAKIVAVYEDTRSHLSKIIPAEIKEATASGALVLTPQNTKVKEVYGNNVIIYNNINEVPLLINHYIAKSNESILKEKVLRAHNITAQKLSSKASAQRFKKILDWFKNN